jgi:Na+-driven multidrug efflux pump
MVLLYMVGSGLDSASCALIGQALGANNESAAKDFYSTFKLIGSFLIGVVMVVQWTLKEQIVNMYTSIPSVRSEALGAIWLLLFNIFPDLYKGMLKGVIKAKGI